MTENPSKGLNEKQFASFIVLLYLIRSKTKIEEFRE